MSKITLFLHCIFQSKGLTEYRVPADPTKSSPWATNGPPPRSRMRTFFQAPKLTESAFGFQDSTFSKNTSLCKPLLHRSSFNITPSDNTSGQGSTFTTPNASDKPSTLSQNCTSEIFQTCTSQNTSAPAPQIEKQSVDTTEPSTIFSPILDLLSKSCNKETNVSDLLQTIKEYFIDSVTNQCPVSTGNQMQKTRPIQLSSSLSVPMQNIQHQGSSSSTDSENSVSNRNEKSIMHFCNYVQTKLGLLRPDQRIFAEKLIHDVLLEAEFDKLSKSSFVKA